jgi:RNA polymerase sigma-70 factor (ECF subfamily)
VGSKTPGNDALVRREESFRAAIGEFGTVLDRIAAGYEADADKRHDLRQEIHLQLWRSLELFDGRCSLKTWTLRVAHNTAASHVSRERRWRSRFVSIEELESQADESYNQSSAAVALDRERALDQLYVLIRGLKPLDREVILCWLEDLDASSIAEITGLSPANVAMKAHRIRNLLARRFHQEQQVCLDRQRPSV